MAEIYDGCCAKAMALSFPRALWHHASPVKRGGVMNTHVRNRLSLCLGLLLIAGVAGGCGKSKTMRGAEVGGANKGCYQYKTKDKHFKHVSQQATVETKWYEEWTSLHGKTLPQPLPPPDHWQHPKLSSRYAATMHENSFATDVSVEPGPMPNHAKVEYFHVLEKGTKLSGMSPLYTFLDDNTVVTISFGRDSA
ncbi:MAG: hypothetical protein JRE73_16440, partial [Deltaproteobacteria bacterium]|nr:hypothetical protein [Deltaproteobacteria bacterium]